jgi:WD40 repeat protein
MKKLVLLTVLCFAALSAGAQSPELFLQMGHSGTINAVAYSPNGRRIATGSSDNTIKI